MYLTLYKYLKSDSSLTLNDVPWGHNLREAGNYYSLVLEDAVVKVDNQQAKGYAIKQIAVDFESLTMTLLQEVSYVVPETKRRVINDSSKATIAS